MALHSSEITHVYTHTHSLSHTHTNIYTTTHLISLSLTHLLTTPQYTHITTSSHIYTHRSCTQRLLIIPDVCISFWESSWCFRASLPQRPVFTLTVVIYSRQEHTLGRGVGPRLYGLQWLLGTVV